MYNINERGSEHAVPQLDWGSPPRGQVIPVQVCPLLPLHATPHKAE